MKIIPVMQCVSVVCITGLPPLRKKCAGGFNGGPKTETRGHPSMASSTPGAKETTAACVRQRNHPRPPFSRKVRKKCLDADDLSLETIHGAKSPDRPGRGWRIAVYQCAADGGGQSFEMVGIALLRGNHHAPWHVADG